MRSPRSLLVAVLHLRPASARVSRSRRFSSLAMPQCITTTSSGRAKTRERAAWRKSPWQSIRDFPFTFLVFHCLSLSFTAFSCLSLPFLVFLSFCLSCPLFSPLSAAQLIFATFVQFPHSAYFKLPKIKKISSRRKIPVTAWL